MTHESRVTHRTTAERTEGAPLKPSLGLIAEILQLHRVSPPLVRAFGRVQPPSLYLADFIVVSISRRRIALMRDW